MEIAQNLQHSLRSPNLGVGVNRYVRVGRMTGNNGRRQLGLQLHQSTLAGRLERLRSKQSFENSAVSGCHEDLLWTAHSSEEMHVSGIVFPLAFSECDLLALLLAHGPDAHATAPHRTRFGAGIGFCQGPGYRVNLIGLGFWARIVGYLGHSLHFIPRLRKSSTLFFNRFLGFRQWLGGERKSFRFGFFNLL